FANFDGGVAYVITNPKNTTDNNSSQVVQMQKYAGAPWGGATLTLPTPVAIDNSIFSMKVWSDRAVNVLFKLEGMDIEKNVAHSGTGWEALTFDFSGKAGMLTQMTFIFDLGITGNADADPTNWTFFFDDIKLLNDSVNAADTAGDGVVDNDDLCPSTPENASVDANGCIIEASIDSDGDGIDDNNDQCANTPVDTVVDGLGCPLSNDSITGIVQDSETSAYFYVNTT